MKYDKECPKYSETMAKKNELDNSGGGNSGDNKKSQKHAWKFTKTNDTIERNNQKFYWCVKCNGGKGMYASSHGPGHPTKPVHDDNFRATQQQPAEGQQNLAVDSIGGEGSSISFGGVDFDMPAGFFGLIVDPFDEVHTKAKGR
jgi:hypothetical protein